MTRATEACERLAQTRGQLRQAICVATEAAKPKGSPTVGWMGRLWSRLKSSPGTRPLAQNVDEWAARSPLPTAAVLVVDALDATLRPVAQHHPWRLVGGAFVLGGALVWGRPWRRLVSPALLGVLLPKLLATMLGNVTRPAWITLAGALLNRQRAASQA